MLGNIGTEVGHVKLKVAIKYMAFSVRVGSLGLSLFICKMGIAVVP